MEAHESDETLLVTSDDTPSSLGDMVRNSSHEL
jgi:hypothetical protein